MLMHQHSVLVEQVVYIRYEAVGNTQYKLHIINKTANYGRVILIELYDMRVDFDG